MTMKNLPVSFWRKITLGLFFSTVLATVSFAVEPMNVLFIGNSYTHMNKMPALFEQIAHSKGVKINVEMSAKSNHTFKMHCERPDLFQDIRKRKWDYVVLQGFSRELSFDPTYIDTATIPYMNKIIDSIYANNPCTNILLYMTWGYENGFQEIEELNSYEKMSEKVRNGYRYVSEVFALPIVPVGDVWNQIRSYNRISLYREDQQHPTLEASYLIACTFYSAIFKATPNGGYIPKISKRNADKIQETAYNYVIANVDTFNLLRNTPKVKYERTSKGEFYAYCKANYPNADSILWDFGDGQSSVSSEVKHKYKKEGSYFIKLTVNDQCGTREIYRKVEFKAPAKPSKRKPSKPEVDAFNGKKI